MSNVCRPYRGGLGDNIGAEVLGFRSRATRMTARRSAAVYEFPDRLIIIADHLTEAGFWRAGLPVVRLLTSATDEVVGQGVQRALTEPPARIPATPWKEYAPVRLALASAAGFRSWGPFDRRARLCSVRVSETGLVEIIPTRHGGTRGADKGFHDRAELALSVGHEPSTEGLGAGVRQGLALSLWPSKLR
jgi:hypothetical protein